MSQNDYRLTQVLAGGSLLAVSTANEDKLESSPVPMTRFALP
jgi:hypothetical protein